MGCADQHEFTPGQDLNIILTLFQLDASFDAVTTSDSLKTVTTGYQLYC